MKSVDVLLSSGFLAFASHLGCLQAVGERCHVGAIVGTSSGALVGALAAAGLPTRQVAKLVSSTAPLRRMRLCWRPISGLFSLGPLIELLERELPATFAELPTPLAVGVTEADGRHRLLTEGPLPLAVAASCAVPGLIRAVTLDGKAYQDGGKSDRLGVDAWRRWRPKRTGLLHRVQRTRGAQRVSDTTGLVVVESPPAGESLLKLRNFERQVTQAWVRAHRTMLSSSLEGVQTTCLMDG